MPRYRVIVASPFEGGRDDAEFTLDTSDPRTADEIGATAREIAQTVAGDYCDSGTVSVVNTRDRADRAHVARRVLS